MPQPDDLSDLIGSCLDGAATPADEARLADRAGTQDADEVAVRGEESAPQGFHEEAPRAAGGGDISSGRSWSGVDAGLLGTCSG